MKTAELTGAQLNWAVQQCEGQTCRWWTEEYTPATNWAQGGPIIEREWLNITPWPNESDEELRWQCKQHDSLDCVAFGPTPLIAAMRCYVASKLGDEVYVAGELKEVT